MGIVDEDVARVRSATDIVGLVGEHVQLRRVGRRWQGLCPFHAEKTPSFSVNAEEGLYHCFGCQASGDVITFVREIDHVDFVGAVERLAGRAGITLRYTSRNEGESRRRREALHDAVAAAVAWYHDRLLTSSDAGPARKYLRERGLDGEAVRKYQIGWAPDDWDALARSLGLSDKLLEASGLGFVNRRGRQQDTFRARVLFPIHDDRGTPVGFGGRILPGAEGAKYKNSPESPIYAKSKLLYGLHLAKADIVANDQAIVCEGYTDVIGFDQVGLPRAVATCGTALTEDHIRVLDRFARRLVLAFDADAAGQAAAERLYQWEASFDIELVVARLPAGVDPADLARRDPEALQRAVSDAQPFLQFRVERVLAAADLSTAEGRARAATRAASVVAEHPDALVRDQYLMSIADRCRVDVARLRDVRPGAVPERGERRVPNEPERSAPVDDRAGVRPGRDHDALEVDLIRLVLHMPDQVPGYVDEDLLADDVLRAAFGVLLDTESNREAIDRAPPEVAALLQALVVAEPPEDDPSAIVARLVDRAAVRQLRDLEAELRSTGDLDRSRDMAAVQMQLADLRASGWQAELAERLLDLLRRAEGVRGHE